MADRVVPGRRLEIEDPVLDGLGLLVTSKKKGPISPMAERQISKPVS
jgi:hypothetical protein